MQHEELCREVERQANFHPCARTDFDYLSEKIQAKTHETLSANTLMRLWGYRESVNARRATLDILSRFVGYKDYAHFIAARGLKEEVEEDPTLTPLKEEETLQDSAPKETESPTLPPLKEEKPLPDPTSEETEQDTSRCHLVHRSDVGRGFGDSDIYLEYFSNEPAKPGLLIGQKIFLQPGSYKVGACFFAQNAQGDETNVRFVVKGTEAFTGCPVLMDGWCVHFTLSEPQEVTIGLWAPEGCDVRRAGICLPEILKE